MNCKILILNRLLDKYERSRAYLDESSANRRILLRLCSPEFPEYDIETSERRELVNSVVQELYEKGLVEYEWLKHEQGNILDKVWLRLDGIPDAYREAGRIPKREKAAAALAAVRECRQSVTLPWLEEFLAGAEAGIEARKSAVPFLPEDVEQAQAVLKALRAINDKGEEECLERIFSLRCFGDSKFFEKNVRKKVADVIRKHLLGEDIDLEAPADDEILAQVGIVKAPEQVEFCGGLVGRLAGEPVDFSVFRHGIAINSPTVAGLEITGFTSVRRVMFIENKANYVDYVSKNKGEDELVIFHGGFFSPSRGLFFQKVYEAGRGAVGFDEKYGAALEKLLGLPDYAEFHDLIRTMLAERAKLE